MLDSCKLIELVSREGEKILKTLVNGFRYGVLAIFLSGCIPKLSFRSTSTGAA